MNHNKKKIWLETLQAINRMDIICAVGFLLCLGARMVGLETVSGILSILFTVVSAWVALSVMHLREKDKEAASYNMIWGSGALTILLLGCAAVQIKLWFGL